MKKRVLFFLGMAVTAGGGSQGVRGGQGGQRLYGGRHTLYQCHERPVCGL